MAGKRYMRKVEPVREPSDVDLAWIAGLYEGEGNCFESPKRQLSCGIYQKDPEILYWCLEMFGGSIGQLRHKAPDKVCHVWNLGGDDARMFLQVIYPFMSARRKAQIDQTSFRRFTGVVRNTRPEMSEERKASRALKSAKQRKEESKKQWIANNREVFNAWERERNRKRYARSKAAQVSEQPNISVQ